MRDRRLLVPAVGFVAVVLVPRLLLLPAVAPSPDEMTYALIGREILAGHWPYSTVFDHKPVALYLPFAAAIGLLGESSTSLRLLSAVVASAAYLLTWVATRRLGADVWTATGAAVLLSLLTLGNEGAAALSEPILNVYLLVLVVLGTLPRTWVSALGVGAVAALAVHTNYLVGPTCLALTVWFLRDSARLSHWLATAGGAVVTTAALLLPVAWRSDLGDYADLQLRFLRGYDAPAEGVGATVGAWHEMLAPQIPLVALAVLLAVLSPEARSPRVRAWGIVLLVSAAAISVNGFFYPHYAMLLAVPLTMGIAEQLRHWAPTRRRAVVAVTVVVAAWSLVPPMAPLLTSTARSVVVHRSLGPDPSQPASVVAAAVREVAAPGDVVYSPDVSVYLLTGTRPPIRFFFPDHHLLPAMTASLGTSPAAQMREVVAARPTVVVLLPSTHPLPSESAAVLQPYLDERCRVHREIGRSRVLDCSR